MCAYCRFCIRMNERTIVFSSSDSQADNALVMVVELLSFHAPPFDVLAAAARR